ncbi:metallophosphoesterase [Bacillus alkalicellulosilyticus]|uniref:metallophosphoesterase n=1 Tax=Alkalihalobacterium alkalicellulosilyticum TaxID=1912214 RepID=UPI00099710FC|nr:metallophosphoesterase [Bacillus alkalicellulosilyticus]
MSERTLVISDIHGCIDEFNLLLKKVKYEPRVDKLVLLGDYLDYGIYSKEVVEKVMNLVEEFGVVAIKGNHDQRFYDFIHSKNKEVESKFFKHGGHNTLLNYAEEHQENGVLELERFKSHVKKEYSHHLQFLEKLPFYHEDDNYIYVHAGLNPYNKDWKKQSEHDFMYIREAFINYPTVTNKKVIFGHTKLIDIHGNADIWFGNDKIGIDGGCAYGFQLNCLEIGPNNKHNVYCINSHSDAVL